MGCELTEVDSSECRVNGRKDFPSPALRNQETGKHTAGLHGSTLLMHVTFYFLFNVFAVVL